MANFQLKAYPRETEPAYYEVRDTLAAIAADGATHTLVRSDIASLLAHATNLVNGTTKNDGEEVAAFVKNVEQLAKHSEMLAADKKKLQEKIKAFRNEYAKGGISKIKMAISALVLGVLAAGAGEFIKEGLPEKKKEHRDGQTLLSVLLKKDVTPGNLGATFDNLWNDIRKEANLSSQIFKRKNSLEVVEINPVDTLEIKADEELGGKKIIKISGKNGTTGNQSSYVLQREGDGPVMISQDGITFQLADEKNVEEILKVFAGF